MATVIYVSPDGDDRSPGSESAPFRTLLRARDEVRKLTRKAPGDITVLLRGGTHEIAEPVVFDSRDSAPDGCHIVYRAYPGESPTISGGRRIAGWTPDAGGRWKAPASGRFSRESSVARSAWTPNALPDCADFRQLYVNGRRAVRARSPYGEPDLQLVGPNTYRTSLASMADWRNPSDIELCYLVVWCHTRCKVESIRRDGDGAVITMQEPCFTLARKKEGVHVELPTYVENALELLTQPGQWYLDRPAGVVYYMPLPGEDMTRAEVIAPAVETLLLLGGTPDEPVRNITFEGLTFAHGTWLRPSQCGLPDIQANFLLAPDDELRPLGTALLERSGWLVHVHHEYPRSPANVVCRSAQGIRLEKCVFTRLGGAGLDLECGCRDNVVIGCEFSDIAGTAIQVGGVMRDDHHPCDERLIVRNNEILNCRIHHCALDYMGGVGIFVGYTERTRIAHNEIAHLPYSGMSVGWGWGEEDVGGGSCRFPGECPAPERCPHSEPHGSSKASREPPTGGSEQYFMPWRYITPTPARGNIIELNHIHHTMQVLEDGGAIYTLGRQPGSIIRANHIHDCKGPPGGIYLDEGSGCIEVTGNLAYNVPKPLNLNNAAQNRIATCPIHDNSWDGGWSEARVRSGATSAGIEPPNAS